MTNTSWSDSVEPWFEPAREVTRAALRQVNYGKREFEMSHLASWEVTSNWLVRAATLEAKMPRPNSIQSALMGPWLQAFRSTLLQDCGTINATYGKTLALKLSVQWKGSTQPIGMANKGCRLMVKRKAWVTGHLEEDGSRILERERRERPEHAVQREIIE